MDIKNFGNLSLSRVLSDIHWVIGETKFNNLGLNIGDCLAIAKHWNITKENCIVYLIQKIDIENFIHFSINLKKDQTVPFNYFE